MPPRRHPATPLLLAAALTLPALPACKSGWDGGRLYVRKWQPAWRARFRDATYRVGLPGDGWRRHDEPGLQVAWRHRGHNALITVRAQCEEHGDSSLEQFTDHLRIDFTDWNLIEQKTLMLVGRSALRSHVQAAIDGVPVELDIIVLKKNGCLFDLTLAAVPRGFQGAGSSFQRVVEGFEFPVREG